MTMGGFYWHALVQSTNVGAPVNHKDRIIHHEQRWGAQQRVKPTMTRSSRSGEIHLKGLREGGGEHRSRHRSIIYEGDVANAVEWHQIKLNMLCDVPAAFNRGTSLATICACRAARRLQTTSWPATTVSGNSFLWILFPFPFLAQSERVSVGGDCSSNDMHISRSRLQDLCLVW